MHPETTSEAVPLVRLLAAVGAFALGLALLVAPAPVQADEHDDDEVTPARVDGANRFETAANIARLTFDSSEVAHVVTGQDFPDALAASYAAGQGDSPLLLVTRTGVPQATWDVLDELDVSSIVLIGGTGTISAEVEQELADADFEVTRVFGANRYETSAEVARQHAAGGTIGTIDGHRTAILASGEDYPDALAAGPLAAAQDFPLFLTPRDATTNAVNSAIADLGISRLIVVGGQGAVSSGVVQAYQDAGYEVERFGGTNRMATSVVVADNALARFGFTTDIVLLARGNDYPDALSASIHGATIGAPILLAATPNTLSDVTEAWFEAACPHVDAIRALGGVGAISEATLGQAVDAAERCHTEDPGFAFCGNVEAGYTVSYPDHWVTNITSENGVPACSLFDPDPDAIRVEGDHVPEDIGAYLRAEDVDFDDAGTAGPGEEEISRAETTVDDRDAVRLETRATGDGAHPEGTLQLRWVVDLDDTTFIAVSYDIGEPTFQDKMNVLDIMMDTIVFDD